MKAWTFTWVSFVGMLAGTFVYVNAGSELARIETAGDIYSPRVLLSLAALALLPWVVKLVQGAWQRGVRAGRMTAPHTLVLFNYDWDRLGFSRWATEFPDGQRRFRPVQLSQQCAPRQFRPASASSTAWPRRAGRAGWQAVTSNHEQFGALAAALLAERMGWPGTPVGAVLACQHKFYARQVLAAGRAGGQHAVRPAGIALRRAGAGRHRPIPSSSSRSRPPSRCWRAWCATARN